MLKAIAEVISSERDTNGNTHHLARFYSVERGRQELMTVELGGPSNAASILFKLFGDHESSLIIMHTESKSDWKYIRKHAPVLYYESPETMLSLATFYGITSKESK